MIFHGDCLEVLRTLPDNSVDAVVTDPPYGLSFMGKRWDYDVPSVDVWAECMRVLKPGGHLLAFAGTRTQHRMAVRIEDAGFEIRDMIAWVYGSGFPKSRNLSGDWQGWGTALKPALEPITVARKPLGGTVAENVLTHGTGALNIDGCRVGTGGDKGVWPVTTRTAERGSMAGPMSAAATDQASGRWPANLIHDGSEEVLGLFPANAGGGFGKRGALNGGATAWGFKGELQEVGYGDSGSAARFFYCARQDDVLPPEVCHNEAWQDQNLTQSSALTAEQSLSLLKAVGDIVQNAVAIWQSLEGILSNAQSGAFTSVTQSELKTINEVVTATIANIGSGSLPEQQLEKPTQCGSRVKCAAMKEPTGITTITTSLCKSDGCVAVVISTITQTNLERGVSASRFNYCAKASKRDRDEGLEGFELHAPDHGKGNTAGGLQVSNSKNPRANTHPTVKPTDLMRYLCRLVTPPGGTVLDPFMGSGSTGKAAMLEGFQFIGIERDAEYLEIARARINAVQPNLL